MLKIQNSNTASVWNLKFFNLFRISGFGFRISARKGFGLIEIIIALGIFTGTLVAFLQVQTLALKLLRNEKNILEANLLAQEGIEASRAFRDQGWNNISGLTPGTLYYPVMENGKWKLTSSDPGPVEGFTRQITVEDVFRDSQDRIISSGGTSDPKSKKLTSQVFLNGGSLARVRTILTDFQSYLGISEEAKSIWFENSAHGTLPIPDFPSNDTGDGDLAQGFITSGGTLNVTRVSLHLRRMTANPSNIYVEIRTTPAGAVKGISNFINSSTITGDSLSWVDFYFYEPISLNASTNYYIRLRSSPDSTVAGSGSQGTVAWGFAQSNLYAGGAARWGVGQSFAGNQGQELSDYDFGFRIYEIP